MLFPSKLTHYLSKEIGIQDFRHAFPFEIVKTELFFGFINLASIGIVLRALAFEGTLKVPLWKAFSGFALAYVALACVEGLITYWKTKKQIPFFVSLVEEEEQTPSSSPYFSREEFQNKTPRTTARLYLEGKISRLDFVLAVSRFRLRAPRFIFFLFFAIFAFFFLRSAKGFFFRSPLRN